MDEKESSDRVFIVSGVLLALMPVVSFLLQYALSVTSGMRSMFFGHLTVTIVDWLFVPFNFLVVRVIDWSRGAMLFALTAIAIILNILAHAEWQYQFVKTYMVGPGQLFLPAGWVHLAYSTLQAVLLLALIFASRPSSPYLWVTKLLGVSYFVAAGVCGYIMNRGFILTDVIMVSCGLLLLVGFPLVRPLRQCVARRVSGESSRIL